MLLALLVAEGANLFRVYQVVANAAREGARLSMLPQDRYLAVNQVTSAHLTNPQTCTFRGGSVASDHPVCAGVAQYAQNNNIGGTSSIQCSTLTVMVNQTYAPPSDSGNPNYSQVSVTCAYTLRYLPLLPFYSIAAPVNIQRSATFANLY
jgi:hypothetical protein